MTRLLLVVGATFLVAGAGVIHGLRTDRWGAKADIEAAASHLDGVPMTIGEWEGRPTVISARQLALAEAVGHLSRLDVNRRTGMEVSVVVLCGRPGPISLHSPEVCYTGSGFAQKGDTELRSVKGDDGVTASLYKAQFVKPGAVPDVLNVFWAWKANGAWAATANPRLAFFRSTVLYKLYAVRRLARPDENLAEEPCLDFLREFLPELKKRLSPSA